MLDLAVSPAVRRVRWPSRAVVRRVRASLVELGAACPRAPSRPRCAVCRVRARAARARSRRRAVAVRRRSSPSRSAGSSSPARRTSRARSRRCGRRCSPRRSPSTTRSSCPVPLHWRRRLAARLRSHVAARDARVSRAPARARPSSRCGARAHAPRAEHAARARSARANVDGAFELARRRAAARGRARRRRRDDRRDARRRRDARCAPPARRAVIGVALARAESTTSARG